MYLAPPQRVTPNFVIHSTKLSSDLSESDVQPTNIPLSVFPVPSKCLMLLPYGEKTMTIC